MNLAHNLAKALFCRNLSQFWAMNSGMRLSAASGGRRSVLSRAVRLVVFADLAQIRPGFNRIQTYLRQAAKIFCVKARPNLSRFALRPENDGLVA